MGTVGLIVEYNPLHNGHHYHFEQAKKVTGADTAVAVMSGHFLQRGEPALVNKWARAEMALSMGIDLVVELPFAYATQNAEMFAFGAVSILDELGIVDSLCFGSESGNLEWMMTLASLLEEEPAPFTQEIQKQLRQGLPYPRAYADAAQVLMREHGFEDIPVNQPNNILGLNYLLSLKRRNSTIQPYTIERKKAGYHQRDITDARIASATAIRSRLMEKQDLAAIRDYVPPATYDILQREIKEKRGPVHWDNFYRLILSRIIQSQVDDLKNLHEMTEGLEYRFKQFVLTSESVDELLNRVKSKRYTWNRLQRILISVLFQLEKQDYQQLQVKQGPPYVRVLGFNEKGQALLKKVRKTCRLPIITNISREQPPMLELDVKAGAMYALGYPGPVRQEELRREYVQTPVRI
ncbi:MAG: nucleotidyltransferase [Bacillaceae bacterium]|nr:nucleotidyltransferase [Bacillaceae bacterium]